MDYTRIIEAVITLVVAVLTTFIIPLIKEKIDADKLKKWQIYTDIAVQAAEQLFTTEQFKEKKQYVLEYLAEKGVRLDPDTIDNLIEASVLLLHNELYGTERR